MLTATQMQQRDEAERAKAWRYENALGRRDDATRRIGILDTAIAEFDTKIAGLTKALKAATDQIDPSVITVDMSSVAATGDLAIGGVGIFYGGNLRNTVRAIIGASLAYLERERHEKVTRRETEQRKLAQAVEDLKEFGE